MTDMIWIDEASDVPEHVWATCPEIHGKLLRWWFNDDNAPMTASEVRARQAIDAARSPGFYKLDVTDEHPHW